VLGSLEPAPKCRFEGTMRPLYGNGSERDPARRLRSEGIPAARAETSILLGVTRRGRTYARRVVRVTIEDFESARKDLQEQVVPTVSKAPGFVAGYWTRSEDGSNGIGMILFDSEESARTASGMIGDRATVGVTLDGVEIREVVQHA
jgi:hypothetical protein